MKRSEKQNTQKEPLFYFYKNTSNVSKKTITGPYPNVEAG